MPFIIFILFLGLAPSILSQDEVKLEGYIKSYNEESPLSNCNIYVKQTGTGTTSNSDGYYKIYLPKGNYTVKFSYVGFKTVEKRLNLNNHRRLDVKLKESVIMEDEVVVEGAESDYDLTIQNIEAESIDKMPLIYNDVMRSVQILSGVATNNELTSGYNVRGGSFDENLIYLNGYEIFRPFLLNQGVEESQTIVNPDLVNDLTFFNGNFPARFGDKMSSALSVDYGYPSSNHLEGRAKLDLMNGSVSAGQSFDNFSWTAGLRYAYPSLFMETLQTTGDYSPSYSDFQLMLNYRFSERSSLELFGLYAENKYKLLPKKWVGHFATGLFQFDQVTIDKEGKQYYQYFTKLFGVKYKHLLGDNSMFKIQASYYGSDEFEKQNIESSIYHSPDAYRPNENLKYLKSRYEYKNSALNLYNYNIDADFITKLGDHNLRAGAKYKDIHYTFRRDEILYETGEKSVLQTPEIAKANKDNHFYSASVFAEDKYNIIDNVLVLNLGFRNTYYSMTDENLFSPRMMLNYYASNRHSFNLGFGYYYQPPFYSALTNTGMAEELKSQKSIHYGVGWNYQFEEKMKVNVQAYYKSLYNLIPFYFEDVKMVYYGGNQNEGYSWGLDVMFNGEIVEGMNSRIGYSYLNSKERKIGSDEPYRRRLLDQTHTLQVFLQDKIDKHPNWQSHLRFLFGSGFLYNYRSIETDPETGNRQLTVNPNFRDEFTMYLRVDMGLSAKYRLSDNYGILFIAEVLNVFNRYNYAGYDWMLIQNDPGSLVNVPRILSKRFFNLKVKLSF